MAVVHPKPEGSSEGGDPIRSDDFRVVDPVEADAVAGGAVVEVPRELDGAPPVVALARVAWVLGVVFVAIVFRRAVDLFNVAHVCRDDSQI